jgi:hypothetical protein
MFDTFSANCISSGSRLADPAAWVEMLTTHDGHELTDAERIDQIRELERLKAAAAAAQARITEAFDRSQREVAPTLKSVSEISRSIASQVALARRESPSRGQQHLGVALALVRDLPNTLATLTDGEISEWRATLVVRETATLTREDRMEVDTELAGELSGAGDRRIGDLARSIGYRLDPGAALRRNQKAETDRRVTIRPAPDTMSHVTGLLPVARGVAVYAALRNHAKSLRTQGDPRTISQIMADTFYTRLTGQETAAGGVEIQLVMNERTLLRGDHQPAHVPGYGSIPAFLARRIVREAQQAWIRRLYTAPATNELVAMDSKRRTFRGKLRQLIILRDQTCRTPWCDAPIAHTDHIRRARRGGATSAANGQGLCEACNYAKEAPGWRADVINIAPHTVEITTPTRHRYRSNPPPQPGDPPAMPVERRLRQLLDDAS